ncbi:hypothetical protein MUU49_17495 [Scandinavium goeteborgense]|uniref:hypothetical protein n=1 Tax=Scandinavium goeteborgense TaxID=1851514 RepID=UPI002166917C|nr:hypothetical protein [Scandinavium goeteborgense]MCS2154353.1 hypothetical protein [Scandinavium goeteborgense]
MSINLSSVTTGMLCQSFRLTHPAENDWSDPKDEMLCSGVISPASPDGAQFLPEGTRLHNTIEIYSASAVRFGDVINYRNQFFKTVHCQDYAAYGYYYALAVLINEPANPAGAGFIDV